MVIKRLLIKLSLEQSKTPHPHFAYEFYLKSRHLFNLIERTCLSKLKQRADYDTICIDARYGFDAPYGAKRRACLSWRPYDRLAL